MQTGEFVGCHLGRLFLILLLHQGLAAPGFPAEQGEASEDSQASSIALANPFGSGEKDRLLLQNFIKPSLKDNQKGLELNTFEQEVFFLFHLYDYDHNGFLDGLELMKLVSEYNLLLEPGVQNVEEVVVLVDLLLQTQDHNRDGLLTPLELLTPALSQAQNPSNDNAPHQEQAVEVEEKLSNPSLDIKAEIQPQDEETPQQKVEAEIEEHTLPKDKQQTPEIPAGEHGQDDNVPVHPVQTEM